MLKENSNPLTACHRHFECVGMIDSATTAPVVLNFRSIRKSESVSCLLCVGKAHKYSKYRTKLKDMPIFAGSSIEWQVEIHRFRCKVRRYTITEGNNLKYPGTRITYCGA